MIKPPDRRHIWRADLALVFNTFVWGSTFVLVKQALDDISAILFIAVRFLIATAVMAWLFRGRFKLRSTDTCGGILAGICLFLGYAFQTAGLKLTTPSKAGFLTGLTVIAVPLISSVVYKVYPQMSEVLGIVLATAGMGLMTLQGRMDGIARGDMFVILCAVAFAGHIMLLGHFSKTASFESLSVVQLGTTAILALCAFWWLEKPFFHSTPTLWLAILVSSLLSTALAFSIQAWAQQITSATRAALIFALEPVFAWIFSFLVIGEKLPPQSVLGAVLIMAGILLAELKPFGAEQHPSN